MSQSSQSPSPSPSPSPNGKTAVAGAANRVTDAATAEGILTAHHDEERRRARMAELHIAILGGREERNRGCLREGWALVGHRQGTLPARHAGRTSTLDIPSQLSAPPLTRRRSHPTASRLAASGVLRSAFCGVRSAFFMLRQPARSRSFSLRLAGRLAVAAAGDRPLSFSAAECGCGESRESDFSICRE